jgi:Ca2+-binding RTX toxin-like protein
VAELHGTINADVLRGRVNEENEIWGHRGNDDLKGGKASDAMMGGKGDDYLWGDRGDDKLIGDTGNDRLYGSEGDDRLYGGVGDDFLSGGKQDDSLFGGKGDDELHGNSGNDALAGGSGDDVLMGERGNDVLFGGRGNDYVHGGSGDDFIMASSGRDILIGGTGFDTLDFSRTLGPLTIDLGKHTASFGMNGQNTADVRSFEQIIGTDFDDVLYGDRNATVFVGGAGDDVFRTRLGSDTITGGEGADRFIFMKKDTADGSVDTITDFQVGIDKLEIGDFMKGNAGTGGVRIVAGGTADAPEAVVQGLVKGNWVDVVKLAGIDANNVGPDHQPMQLYHLNMDLLG